MFVLEHLPLDLHLDLPTIIEPQLFIIKNGTLIDAPRPQRDIYIEYDDKYKEALDFGAPLSIKRNDFHDYYNAIGLTGPYLHIMAPHSAYYIKGTPHNTIEPLSSYSFWNFTQNPEPLILENFNYEDSVAPTPSPCKLLPPSKCNGQVDRRTALKYFSSVSNDDGVFNYKFTGYKRMKKNEDEIIDEECVGISVEPENRFYNVVEEEEEVSDE